MKRSLRTLLTTSILAAAFAAPAYAAPTQSWYAGASGDVTWMDGSDTGGGGNVNLGYRFNNVRLEGEAGYHDADKGEHYWSYMGNVYYDFSNMYNTAGWNISPYIGAGLGDAEIRDDSELAWQGMAGLNFTSASAPRTTYRIGYKYFGADDHDPKASNIELGMNYAF